MVYRKYARDQAYFAAEGEAKEARRGLWADKNPIPPWEWRHREQTMTNGESMIAPCPFCAGVRTEVVGIDVGKWMVECRDCQTTGPIDNSPGLAEERWNHRQLYPGSGREIRSYG